MRGNNLVDAADMQVSCHKRIGRPHSGLCDIQCSTHHSTEPRQGPLWMLGKHSQAQQISAHHIPGRLRRQSQAGPRRGEPLQTSISILQLTSGMWSQGLLGNRCVPHPSSAHGPQIATLHLFRRRQRECIGEERRRPTWTSREKTWSPWRPHSVMCLPHSPGPAPTGWAREGHRHSAHLHRLPFQRRRNLPLPEALRSRQNSRLTAQLNSHLCQMPARQWASMLKRLLPALRDLSGWLTSPLRSLLQPHSI